MRDEVAGDLIESSDHLLSIMAQQHTRMRTEPFGAADVTFFVHEHDSFELRVETEPARANGVSRSAFRR
jgi:hypothetical protein